MMGIDVFLLDEGIPSLASVEHAAGLGRFTDTLFWFPMVQMDANSVCS